MVKTRFYLDCRRAKADGLGTLKISIFKDNVRALIPLNIKLPSRCWDADKQIAKEGYEDLNPMLLQRKAVIDSFIFKKESSGEFNGMRSCEIKDLVIAHLFGETPQVEKVPANNFKARFYDFQKSKSKAGTRRVYEETWRLIERFGRKEKFKPEKLTFEDITVKWLNDFNAFMAETSNSQNYRNIHLRNIRAVFNDAIDADVTILYPFRRFKIKAVETRKRSLSVESLRTLFNCKVEKYAEFYRDMFKLTFFLIGINPVDLASLDSITKDGRVEYTRAKTYRDYSIKVEPEALEIINRYRGKAKLLSIMDRWKDYMNFTRQMNKAIQCMGAKRTGLGGKKSPNGPFSDVTIYWARHSWATIARKIGISKDDIRLALGHGQKTVTDIYIDEDQEKIDAANRKVIDWVLYSKC